MTVKDGNPKDPLGVRKWRTFTTLPMTVMAEVGVAFLEGHMKGYRRHNYRVAGATASVYIDAAMGHIAQWWEGEDIDADSRINHLSKAIASLMIVRDAEMQNVLNDDRPPKANLEKVRADLQAVVDSLFEKYPDAVDPYTELGLSSITGTAVGGNTVTVGNADVKKLFATSADDRKLPTASDIANGWLKPKGGSI